MKKTLLQFILVAAVAVMMTTTAINSSRDNRPLNNEIILERNATVCQNYELMTLETTSSYTNYTLKQVAEALQQQKLASLNSTAMNETQDYKFSIAVYYNDTVKKCTLRGVNCVVKQKIVCKTTGISQGEKIDFEAEYNGNSCPWPFEKLFPLGTKVEPYNGDYFNINFYVYNSTACEKYEAI